MALSWATVAPVLAARVAPILRRPCADFFIPAALQASENALPNDSLVKGLPFALLMKVRSPVGPCAIASCNSGNIGKFTSVAVFSVRIVAITSRTCWRPIRTSPTRKTTACPGHHSETISCHGGLASRSSSLAHHRHHLADAKRWRWGVASGPLYHLR